MSVADIIRHLPAASRLVIELEVSDEDLKSIIAHYPPDSFIRQHAEEHLYHRDPDGFLEVCTLPVYLRHMHSHDPEMFEQVALQAFSSNARDIRVIVDLLLSKGVAIHSELYSILYEWIIHNGSVVDLQRLEGLGH